VAFERGVAGLRPLNFPATARATCFQEGANIDSYVVPENFWNVCCITQASILLSHDNFSTYDF
jgi:hypothetical protein